MNIVSLMLGKTEKSGNAQRLLSTELSSLLAVASGEGIDALRATHKLVRKCRSEDERALIIDALPKRPMVEFAFRMEELDRVEIAATLLWFAYDHFEEVSEICKWLKLPRAGNYEELKLILKEWIVEEN